LRDILTKQGVQARKTTCKETLGPKEWLVKRPPKKKPRKNRNETREGYERWATNNPERTQVRIVYT